MTNKSFAVIVSETKPNTLKKITLAELRSRDDSPAQTKPHSKPATKIPTKEGRLLVNYHGVFFFMSHLGNYIPWCRTLKCGELILTSEYGRLKNLIGKKPVPLSPYQERRAKAHALGLTKSPLYKLTPTQRHNVMLNQEAHKLGISVEQLLYIRKVQAERKNRKVERIRKVPAKSLVPTKKNEYGQTTYDLVYHPGFKSLIQRFSATA